MMDLLEEVLDWFLTEYETVLEWHAHAGLLCRLLGIHYCSKGGIALHYARYTLIVLAALSLILIVTALRVAQLLLA